MKKLQKILFTVGSLNQATQMHQIAQNLPMYDCWFSQYFSDSYLINKAIEYKLVENTIMSGKFRAVATDYLQANHLRIDYQGKQNDYDLVVMCSDLIVPKMVKNTKSLWVQEGMTDEVTWLTHLVKAFGLPSYLSVGTSLNGCSNLIDIYCVASEGYKKHFQNFGTHPSKIMVTGMPNFDDVDKYRYNDFPHHDYLLVATSDIRETFRYEDRLAFLFKCKELAKGRRIIVKLHPNELKDRAIAEIRQALPIDTLIYDYGNINEMIANCDELITQFSTVVYVGIALGKPVHSYFDKAMLYERCPIQNEGTSAANIAQIIDDYIAFEGTKANFLNQYHFQPIQAEYAY